jgi:hypothetical protein
MGHTNQRVTVTSISGVRTLDYIFDEGLFAIRTKIGLEGLLDKQPVDLL